LRTALIEGEESGPSTQFDFDAFIARKRATHPG
jgi:antitoxin ParD1/3/4